MNKNPVPASAKILTGLIRVRKICARGLGEAGIGEEGWGAKCAGGGCLYGRVQAAGSRSYGRAREPPSDKKKKAKKENKSSLFFFRPFHFLLGPRRGQRATKQQGGPKKNKGV